MGGSFFSFFFSFSFRGRGRGQGPPFVRPQNSYDCGEVANGFGVVTIIFVLKNNNVFTKLQNFAKHTYIDVYVC